MSTKLMKRMRQRASGKKFFSSLSTQDKWEIGDQLVWGTFDWQEWGLPQEPSRSFMQGVEEARTNWEAWQ